MPRRKDGTPVPQSLQRSQAQEAQAENRDIKDRYDGPLRNRSFGLRVDDDVEVQVIAGNALITVSGRILSFKDDLEIIDNEGSYHKITMDWIVDIKLIRHNRPLPEVDPEMVRKTVKPKLKKSTIDHAYN